MAQVVSLRDFRAEREAHHRAVFMPRLKAPLPVQLMWNTGAYFFVGFGFTMMFASWMAREMTGMCFTAAAFCDDRGKR